MSNLALISFIIAIFIGAYFAVYNQHGIIDKIASLFFVSVASFIYLMILFGSIAWLVS